MKPRWGLWLFMLLVSSGQPNAVTANNGEIDDGNSNGALVAVETEDDEETDISMYHHVYFSTSYQLVLIDL